MLSWVSRVSGKQQQKPQTGHLPLGDGSAVPAVIDDSKEDDDFVFLDVVDVGDGGSRRQTRGSDETAVNSTSLQGVMSGTASMPSSVITQQPRLSGEVTAASMESFCNTEAGYEGSPEETHPPPLAASDIPVWLTSRMYAILNCHDLSVSTSSSWLPSKPDLSQFEYDFRLERDVIALNHDTIS